jgi:hypothetical protein
MTRFTRLMVGSSLLLALAATPVVRAQHTPTAHPPGVQVAQAPQPTPPGRRGQERHPALRRAMRALENAKGALQQGATDFQGHRVKALELTNQAIQEVQAALASDRQ